MGTKVLHKLNAQTLLLPKLEMTCRVCQGTVFDQLQQKSNTESSTKNISSKK
jgi:hypothetical protein